MCEQKLYSVVRMSPINYDEYYIEETFGGLPIDEALQCGFMNAPSLVADFNDWERIIAVFPEESEELTCSQSAMEIMSEYLDYIEHVSTSFENDLDDEEETRHD